MIGIDNSQAMDEFLRSQDAGPVRFPADTNVLLTGDELRPDALGALEEQASAARRCLHRG